MTLREVFSRSGYDDHDPAAAFGLPAKHPSITEQMTTLTRCGLAPQDGIDAEAIAQDRHAAGWVRHRPYVALMYCLARDAEGHFTRHPRVVHLHLSFVRDETSYPQVVQQLAQAAGTLAEDVTCIRDADGQHYRLRFRVGEVTRDLRLKIDRDRADQEMMPLLYAAIAAPGEKAVRFRHGEDVSVAFVPTRHADQLQRIFHTWSWT